VDVLKCAPLGRSHRAKVGKARLKQVIEETKALLGLPEDYLVAIMPASDTGAVEAALWSLLGPRPVDVFAWESFGKEWVSDCLQQLKALQTRTFVAEFGKLPNLRQANFEHDIVFTWNGTTSGVIVPDGNWIPDDRHGLTICDATSSACAVPMPWTKLDVITFSWQKVLGGEAQHGILVLSPRAVQRLESHTPSWPVPKIFRLAKEKKLSRGIFEGETINTPSMPWPGRVPSAARQRCCGGPWKMPGRSSAGSTVRLGSITWLSIRRRARPRPFACAWRKRPRRA